MTERVKFTFQIMKTSILRHKLAFKQVVRFKIPSVYYRVNWYIDSLWLLFVVAVSVCVYLSVCFILLFVVAVLVCDLLTVMH